MRIRRVRADFFTRNPPGLANLSTMETSQGFLIAGPTYAYAMIGMNQLLTTPGIGSLMTYGDAVAGGTAWATAFQNAFGTSSTAFYNQFPTCRSGLSVPPAYLCGI